MENLLVTSTTAAILALLQCVLMMSAGLGRGAASVSIGDGGNEALLVKIRRHGNLIENAPIFLILLGFLETIASGSIFVLIFASLFTIARFSHPLGLKVDAGVNAFRFVGAFGTLISILGTAITLLWFLYS